MADDTKMKLKKGITAYLRQGFLTFALFLLLVSIACAELRIGSFNTRYLGGGKGKNLSGIAKIIEGEDFSIVALQEVSSEEGVRDLVDYLGAGWEYIVSPQKVANEYFAFIWRGDKKVVLESSEPWDDYRNQFIRAPFIAEFRHDKKIYWIINVHIIHGGSDSSGNLAKRKLELQELHRVFLSVNRTLGYTIILGDFNLDTEDINREDLSFQCYQTSKTTLSSTEDRYSNSYDHFCLDDHSFEVLRPEFVRVKAPEKYFQKDFAKYRGEISDHVPIRMDIGK